MKKINVSKLIDAVESEQYAVRDCKWYSEHEAWQKELAECRERLAKIREEIAELSAPLTDAIAEAEGNRVSARKIDARDIVDDLKTVNSYLGLTKKNLKGTIVYIDHHAQKFPSAYKYTPESTHFKAEFTSNWFITAIWRDTCKTKKYDLYLSDTAQAEYLENVKTLKGCN